MPGAGFWVHLQQDHPFVCAVLGQSGPATAEALFERVSELGGECHTVYDMAAFHFAAEMFRTEIFVWHFCYDEAAGDFAVGPDCTSFTPSAASQASWHLISYDCSRTVVELPRHYEAIRCMYVPARDSSEWQLLLGLSMPG